MQPILNNFKSAGLKFDFTNLPTLFMLRESNYRQRKRPALTPRVMLDYVMGLLWMVGGIFIVFSKAFLGYDYFEQSDLVQGWMKWFIGFIFMLYGLFRIYRGYQLQKENTEREN